MKFSMKKQLVIFAIQSTLLAGSAVSEAFAQGSAPPVDPDKMQQMIANTKEMSKLQKEFEDLGGAKAGTIKSKTEIDTRITLLDSLSKVTNTQSRMVKENGGNEQDGEVFANLLGMQKKSREQLVFLKKHFGKWKVEANGEVDYKVPQSELEAYQKSIRELGDIQIKQLELLRARAEARRKAKSAGGN